jgi:hypothetical protein
VFTASDSYQSLTIHRTNGRPELEWPPRSKTLRMDPLEVFEKTLISRLRQKNVLIAAMRIIWCQEL